MKRHVPISVLIGLAALHGCSGTARAPDLPLVPPPTSVLATPATGQLYLGLQGVAPGRRIQAFARQVASYDVTMTLLETGEQLLYMNGVPAEAGLSKLTCNNMAQGRYRIAVEAHDSQGRLLNASGQADTFFPEGLMVKAWHSVGSEDAPVVLNIELAPTIAGISGSALDFGFQPQDGALETFTPTDDPVPAGKTKQTGVAVISAGQLTASDGQVYSAWQETSTGGAYVGPATLALVPGTDSSGPYSLLATVSDTTVDPPVDRHFKLSFQGTPAQPLLNALSEYGPTPRRQAWLTLRETQAVTFKRTAEPAGSAATRCLLDTGNPLSMQLELYIGPTRQPGDTVGALLGLTLTYPNPDGIGAPKVLHLERLSP